MNIDEIRAFLLARIAEDKEQAAFVQQQHADSPWEEIEPWKLSWHDEYDLLYIAPSRALIECASRRALIADEPRGPDPEPFDLWVRSLRRIAASYITHPDFKPIWTSESAL